MGGSPTRAEPVRAGPAGRGWPVASGRMCRRSCGSWVVAMSCWSRRM